MSGVVGLSAVGHKRTPDSPQPTTGGYRMSHLEGLLIETSLNQWILRIYCAFRRWMPSSHKLPIDLSAADMLLNGRISP